MRMDMTGIRTESGLPELSDITGRVSMYKLIYRVTWPNGKIYVGSDMTQHRLLWPPEAGAHRG